MCNFVQCTLLEFTVHSAILQLYQDTHLFVFSLRLMIKCMGGSMTAKKGSIIVSIKEN